MKLLACQHAVAKKVKKNYLAGTFFFAVWILMLAPQFLSAVYRTKQCHKWAAGQLVENHNVTLESHACHFAGEERHA